MVDDAISFWTDIQRYEDMLAADPNSYCFAPLSELYRKLGLLDDAISVAQKGCQLHPDYPGGFFALGSAYHAKGLGQEARQALERTVSLNPDNLQALKLLGQLYVEIGDLERGQKALQQVLRQNPDDLESSLLLNSLASQIAIAQPEEELLEDLEVIEELTELLDDEAELLEADAELTGLLAESEEPELEELEPVPRQGGRDPLTTATLAELYVTQGHPDQALAIYQQLVSAEPGSQPYRTRVAELKELLARQQQEQQAAAPAPRPAAAAAQVESAPEQAAPPGSDLEAQLGNWLENIRRRRNGL